MEEKILNENTLEVATNGVVETVSAGKRTKILVGSGIVGVVVLAGIGAVAVAKKIKNHKAAKAAEQEANNIVEADFNEVEEDEDSED